MSKKLILVLFFSLFTIAALGTSVPVEKARAIKNMASVPAARQSVDTTRIIERADAMIQTRLQSLATLLARVNSDTRLTSDEKTSFVSDIQTTTTSLTNLKSKIDADTDVATARADAQSIVTSYRIYMVYEPKERLLVVIDNLQTSSANLATLVTKIQTLLTTLKSQGQDVTSAQTALNDVSTQLTAITALLTTDKSLITNVSVSSANPQSVFIQVKKDLATAKQDFLAIKNDFATIRKDIKALKTSPSTASSSAK